MFVKHGLGNCLGDIPEYLQYYMYICVCELCRLRYSYNKFTILMFIFGPVY